MTHTIYSVSRIFTIIVLMSLAGATALAQTLIDRHDFRPLAGGNSSAPLAQGRDGYLYGTTELGGDGGGSVFKISPSGQYYTLHVFKGADGSDAFAGLTLGTDGSLYGTTGGGGENNAGTVFRITAIGTLVTLHSFDGTDGNNPYQSGLVLGLDGDFYGTTNLGGTNNDGTVFKISPTGLFTSVHSFDGTDGSALSATLALGTDGNFYGTAYHGGVNDDGTVFRITPTGIVTTLHTFAGSDGANPQGGLALGNDGNFYGTTLVGGIRDGGTVFKITPTGVFTTLYRFSGADGSNPCGALALGNDGNFYGTTEIDGIFEITPNGAFTKLISFDNANGGLPYAGVIQHTDGQFYGTTYYGGAHGAGTVYSLDTGLTPFLSLLPNYGKAGRTIEFLGQSFIGTTNVFFNGIPASFTVISDTFIKATVPSGATTGYASVNTPSGTLTSNVPFHVIP